MEFDKRVLAGAVVVLLMAFAAGVKYGGYSSEKAGAEAGEEIVITSLADTEEEAKPDKVIQVYVCGQVEKPGVYELKEGARLHEAVNEAVPLETADLKYLGMARQLSDGETIIVPAPGEENDAGTDYTAGAINNPGSAGGGGKININTATAAELEAGLKGIGPVLSRSIVEYRLNNGPFKNIEDLMNVSGIGEKKYAAIKDEICI